MSEHDPLTEHRKTTQSEGQSRPDASHRSLRERIQGRRTRRILGAAAVMVAAGAGIFAYDYKQQSDVSYTVHGERTGLANTFDVGSTAVCRKAQLLFPGGTVVRQTPDVIAGSGVFTSPNNIAFTVPSGSELQLAQPVRLNNSAWVGFRDETHAPDASFMAISRSGTGVSSQTVADELLWVDSRQPHQSIALETDPQHQVRDEACLISKPGQFIAVSDFLPHAVRVGGWGQVLGDHTADKTLGAAGTDLSSYQK